MPVSLDLWAPFLSMGGALIYQRVVQSPHDIFPCFVLTHTIPRITFGYVIHSSTTSNQARLNLEFFLDVLPIK